MIEPASGNIFKDEAEALVNTVNCVGVMGKGIALQFKKAFPDNFKAYEAACRRNEVQPGRMFVYQIGDMFNPRYIVNFPTKRHWRSKSRYEDIESGLQALVWEIQERQIRSIAIPPLGSGLGGLQWARVKGMIEVAFKNMSDIQVRLYEPKGTPDARDMPVGTSQPKMTVARAVLIKLIKLMKQYSRFAYRLTLLEIQKLAYFLQESGMDLLASVHWAAVHDGDVSDGQTAVSAMARWNDRKRNLFKPAHIHSAWERFRIEGWVNA